MTAYVPPEGSIPTLEVPDLTAVRSAHLVGIGGAGMSGIASLLLARGVEVSGSDLKDSPAIAQLRAAGARVDIGHRAEHVTASDVVVASSAIGRDNVELRTAVERSIPVLARAQVLAALMREGRGVAVAGTHGKTTTTSMLAAILEGAGLDPSYVIGGDLNESGSNARSGAGDLFVAEADESDGSFLLLEPEIGIVTNVEDDHLDFFADRTSIEAAFADFCARCGTVVACADDPGARRVVESAGPRTVWYGTGEGSAVRVVSAEPTPGGTQAALVVDASLGAWQGAVEIPVPGRQHALNAAGALAAAILLGVPAGDAAAGLGTFRGVRRRWEHRGETGGVSFVDDYAHHPTELGVTLAAARDREAARVVAVFQPHRYSRTAVMGRELGESLRSADLIVVTDVYAAGEEPVVGVSGKLVVDGLTAAAPGKRVVYLPRRLDLAPFLAREIRAGDLVLTLGAGDITMLADETLALVGRDD